MTNNRIVITGMGIVAPNAHGLIDFEDALRGAKSGIRFQKKLQELNFSCQVAGIPENIDKLKSDYFASDQLIAMSDSMVFAAIAAIDCWKDAGLLIRNDIDPDWDTGAIIGTGISGVDILGDKVIPLVNERHVRRLGSTIIEQAMSSASSANIAGILGLGGEVTSVSSACTTGTEAIALAYFFVKSGRFKRMLAGSTEGISPYIWAGFDSMHVLAKDFNHAPDKASRPLSATAHGFVPAGGAGALMVESLESALARNARIYAEIIGAEVNCGGQRHGGSITAPNSVGVQRCIQNAVKSANIAPSEIDMINGHLTATKSDTIEIFNWQQALGLEPASFPYINSTKSLIGHALGAAGSIEIVGCILQLINGFIHASINCEDLHPRLTAFENRIVRKTIMSPIRTIAKASFGFGDVNACLIFRKWYE